MQELIDSYKKSGHLHHAYFLVGEGEGILENLKSFFENEVGIKISGNPDFWHGKFTTFSIEQARSLTEASERKSFTEATPPYAMSNQSRNLPRQGLGKEMKVFIIQTEIITEEAQNALLKVFEEPTKDTHFFIISPQDVLLPTLRSRMYVIQCESVKVPSVKVESILEMKLKERLEKVKEITEAISDEEKTKQDAITFLNEVEAELYKRGVEKVASELKICEFARASLYDRGAPVKMILENLMLSI